MRLTQDLFFDVKLLKKMFSIILDMRKADRAQHLFLKIVQKIELRL